MALIFRSQSLHFRGLVLEGFLEMTPPGDQLVIPARLPFTSRKSPVDICRLFRLLVSRRRVIAVEVQPSFCDQERAICLCRYSCFGQSAASPSLGPTLGVDERRRSGSRRSPIAKIDKRRLQVARGTEGLVRSEVKELDYRRAVERHYQN